MLFKRAFYKFQFNLRQRIIGSYYKYFRFHDSQTETSFVEPEKVLFVVAGLLGDSVMSLPAIAKAKELWKTSEITLLGKTHNVELFSALPYIDRFYECNTDPFSIRGTGEVNSLRQWLKKERFDIAILLLGDQYAHLLAAAKIPFRVGGKGSLLEACLTHLYDASIPRKWGARERLNSLRCLGYTLEDTEPILFVDEDARITAKKKLSILGLVEGEKYAVLHPFGSTQRQWWNLDRILPLAQELHKKKQLKTVIIGGKETSSSFAKVDDDLLINTTGMLTLRELLAVIHDSDIVITTDSGPFHIAGALKKPIVGLFRNRRPEHATAYSDARVAFGHNDICEKRCEWDACKSDPCLQMQSLSVERVLESVDEALY